MPRTCRSLDVGAVAAVVHTTDTGVVIDTDPHPVTTDAPMDEHISLFLRHARRCAEDTATGLAVDTSPPDTSTGIVIGPTPGVATPVVVVGPTTDGDVGTADGALPYDDDFNPITTGSDRDEVTAVAPDGADLEPTSLDLASARGSDTTAAVPVDTGRMVDGVSDGGFGIDDCADEVLSDDPAWDDGDDATAAMPTSVWGDGDEVTAAIPEAVPTRKRKHIRRPLGPAVRMTAPQRRPFLPPAMAMATLAPVLIPGLLPMLAEWLATYPTGD